MPWDSLAKALRVSAKCKWEKINLPLSEKALFNFKEKAQKLMQNCS